MIRFALFAFALLVAAAAQAQVYKCLDASGRTVYRQDPCPPSMTRETMQKSAIPAAPAAAPSAAAKAGKSEATKGPLTAAEQEQAFRQRQQDSAKAAKESDERANQTRIKEQNCNNAKQRLATYSVGGRITRVDANGERYYLEDSQIEAEKAKAQTDVSQSCN